MENVPYGTVVAAQRNSRPRRGRVRGCLVVAIALLVAAPVGAISFVAQRDQISWSQAAARLVGNSASAKQEVHSAALPPGAKIDFLQPRPIGTAFEALPKISHIKAVDLDENGFPDVVVCDCEDNLVSWIRQQPRGSYEEIVIAEGVQAPAHVDPIDFDGDGDLDLLVAVLGVLFPSDDPIGSVLVLENRGDTTFEKRVILEGVARVSDVRGGDVDGDGDIDLAVAQFGYDSGETRWLENLGGWNFRSHILQELSGGIHCELADMNGDGHLDLCLLVSQEWESIYVFVGDGDGNFEERRIYAANDPNFGSSGIRVHDLDQDGDLDVIYTNGDAFDYLPPQPWPWHGVQWLENRGDLEFRVHRIVDFGGAVNAIPADIDHDGDLDLYAASTFNSFEKPAAQSLIWLENDGEMRFRRRDIANTPTHIQAIDLADFDGDGDQDLVTGGMHVSVPYDRVERIVLWSYGWPDVPPTREQ